MNWQAGDYPHSWRHVALEAMRQAVNLRVAGTVHVRTDDDPSMQQTATHQPAVHLGAIGIVVTALERQHLTSHLLGDKLLAGFNPDAVGM